MLTVWPILPVRSEVKSTKNLAKGRLYLRKVARFLEQALNEPEAVVLGTSLGMAQLLPLFALLTHPLLGLVRSRSPPHPAMSTLIE